MFGISGEHILILAIVLLIFGPRRLPELGNTLGKAIRNFKDSLSGIEEAQYRKLPGEAASGSKDIPKDSTPAKDTHQPTDPKNTDASKPSSESI